MKPTKLPRITVRWKDPQGSATKVFTLADVRNYHKPVVMETTGWLMHEDEEGISLANERFVEDGVENFRGHTFVLRSLIIDVKRAGQKRGKSEGNSNEQ